MQFQPTAPQPPATGRTHGPPRIFWVAQVIAVIVIGLPLIIFGILCLRSGTFFIPFGRRSGRVLEMRHVPAVLASWSCIVAGIAFILHAGLTNFDAIKHAASSAARFAGGIALLLFIGALVTHLVG